MNDKPTVVIPKDPKTSRDNFRLGVPTSKRHERERQRNSPRCAGKIKSRKVEKARRKGGLFYSKSKFPELRSLSENGKRKPPQSASHHRTFPSAAHASKYAA